MLIWSSLGYRPIQHIAVEEIRPFHMSLLYSDVLPLNSTLIVGVVIERASPNEFV